MHPAMMAEIAADQIREMRAQAARDQRARLARRGRRTSHHGATVRAVNLTVAAPARSQATN